MTDLHESDFRRGTVWRPRWQRRWRSVHVIGQGTRAGEPVYIVRRVPELPGERAEPMPVRRLERYYRFARRGARRRLDWGEVPHAAAFRFVAALGLDPTDFGL